MRKLIILIAVTVAFFGAEYASAEHREFRDTQYHPHADKRIHSFRHGNNRFDNRHRGVIRVDIPVSVRGDQRLPLRRMLRHRGYNPNDYHLRAVVFHNDGRRHASARLRVGDQVNNEYHLGRGKTRLRAPRYAQDSGRWVLGLNNARVDHIRIVLEPKHRWAYQQRPYRPQQPWASDYRRGW